uniref:SDR family NAD(P)-dependent oxidoreductase n=1 Tax=Acaryochloris sp. IP29b_bin.137 TaxID=2969217 RepID=UPI002602E930
AAGMADAGYHVVMACRNQLKAEAAKQKLQQQLADAQLDVMIVDLSDLDSVRDFAKLFRARYSHLDVLINNGGILLYSAQTNATGIELQFATNHLGHFLLTALLIDIMPNEASSRVISLSSVAHKEAQIHFDDLSCGGDGGIAYGQSKLACLMFSDELNRRLRAVNSRIRSIPVHPGGSDSGLFKEMSQEQYDSLKGMSQYIHSNADAAKPALFAALDATAEGGTYYGPQGYEELSGPVGPAQRFAYSKRADIATELWTRSEDLTGQRFSL